MYYILYGFLWLFSLLPLPVLYLLSDFVSFILFRVFGYRRHVIENNLLIAFPEKTNEERKAIAKKFHRNFTDTFIETLKALSKGEKFFNRHCQIDIAVLDRLAAEGKNCQMHACHQFNWEWINLHWATHTKQPLVVVYMPVANKAIDKLFYNLRTRYGTVMLPATDIRNTFAVWRNKLHVLALVADQKPGDPSHSHWLNFFNHPTPFVTGPERNARAKKCAVVFGQAMKTGRGKYNTVMTLACEDASLLQPGELTQMYVKFIEKIIRQQPEMYLWSHKRFKFEWNSSYKHLWIDTIPAPEN